MGRFSRCVLMNCVGPMIGGTDGATARPLYKSCPRRRNVFAEVRSRAGLLEHLTLLLCALWAQVDSGAIRNREGHCCLGQAHNPSPVPSRHSDGVRPPHSVRPKPSRELLMDHVHHCCKASDNLVTHPLTSRASFEVMVVAVTV